MNYTLNTQQVSQTLGEAVDSNDLEAFTSTYIAFLKQYPSFNSFYSATPTGARVTNTIFGRKTFFLHVTDDNEADQILDKGRKAKDVFSELPLEERLAFLEILKKKIDEHQKEIELVISADTGKPLDNAAKEMGKGGDWFTFAKGEAPKQLGIHKKDNQILSTQSAGMTQVIGAFNYPYALAIGGIVGALAGGGSVVVASPEKAPNWVFPFRQAADEAVDEFVKTVGKDLSGEQKQALQEGLIQNSNGRNDKLTQAVDIVHFVGGDQTGKAIEKQRLGKRTILEMGGGNHIVVMRSALEQNDPEKIAKEIYDGFAQATGQRCTAPRVLCVEQGAEKIIDAIEKTCDEGPGIELGNPFKTGVKMGPLVDPMAHENMQKAITLAEKLGGHVHGTLHFTPSEHNHAPTQAYLDSTYWVKPVTIDWRDVPEENMPAVRELIHNEIFGPLLQVIKPFNGIKEAIAITNDQDTHKLAGAVYSANEQDAVDFQNGTKVTSVVHNGVPKDQSPYGPHGHPGRATIGGDTHFLLYADVKVLAHTASSLGSNRMPR